jgi:hypothetical protein
VGTPARSCCNAGDRIQPAEAGHTAAAAVGG